MMKSISVCVPVRILQHGCLRVAVAIRISTGQRSTFLPNTRPSIRLVLDDSIFLVGLRFLLPRELSSYVLQNNSRPSVDRCTHALSGRDAPIVVTEQLSRSFGPDSPLKI